MKLLEALLNEGFSFTKVGEYYANLVMRMNAKKFVLLRQDVDRLPNNSLTFARIQKGMGIRSTFYFRIVPQSFDPEVIQEIAGLGHEVGYHYEDLSFAWAKLKATGDRRQATGEELERILVDIAIESFAENLEKLRKIAPVKTICMHGSPLSQWDSRLLWKYYDYHDFGIIGEPYFDVDFDEVLYLTDTGRRWDGGSVSIRDKASGERRQATGENPFKDWKVKPVRYRLETKGRDDVETERLRDEETEEKKDLGPRTHPARRSFLWPPKRSGGGSEGGDPVPFPSFHSTSDIIKAANENRLPDKIMMTFHPQRWTDKPLPWVKELVWQNVKNVGKYLLIRIRD